MPTQRFVTLDTVRRLSIYLQGLHRRPDIPDHEQLKHIIERIGLLQLDSISVVARSHYLVMLARAGLYDRNTLDHLLDDGFLFETWAHAACQLPIADYPYYYAYLQEKQLKESQWHIDKLGDDSQTIIEMVFDSIRKNGAMSSKDFDHDRKEAGGWWNWKPAKIALEYLFDRGELMVSYRRKFQRYYDLPERVLAHKDLILDKTLEDFRHWEAEQGLRHIGIGTINDVADYYRQNKRDTTAQLQTMVSAGTAQQVMVEGWQDSTYIHRDHLELLEKIEAGDHAPELTLFLSPFDNLFWFRERDERLWDFHYRIEVYVPKPKRIYGYYVMPILHQDKLVGRVDPKVDRKKKHLIFYALHLEENTHVTDELTNGLINAIQEFMTFHHCETFELIHCDHEPLKQRLNTYFS